uniref:FBA_2 domain-containing protein n=1 Tax=Caenorhabditis tropicalis TaxID=1561998 RepID=A0A1I7UZQ0_9PELO
MFPFFQLPLLCIQDVSDLWEIVELYNFSLLSKRAKRIAKRKKVNNSMVNLHFNSRSIAFMIGPCDVDFYLNFKQNRFIVDSKECVSLETDISPFLKALQHFLDVSNCRFEMVYFELISPLTDDQLIAIIDWMNGLKTAIEQIVIRYATWPMFELFMSRFRKSISELRPLHLDFKRDNIVLKRLNFEIKYTFSSNFCSWFHLDFLFSMDTEKITVYAINLCAEDLNKYIRSWQEGKTSRKVKQVQLRFSTQRDVKEVLKGCGGELMDPRTTKLSFRGISSSGYNYNYFVYGGIYIRGNDGRLAIVETDGQDYWSDNEGSHAERVQTYLKAQDIWNNENSPDVWNEHLFFIHIFQ